jgi:hypothetical protein
MAYFNLDDKRTERLLNKETKFNLDFGSTPKELKEISNKFYLQNLINKEYNTSKTFPKTIPDLNFGEVRELESRYFSQDTEDLKARMEIQSDFLNQQEEEIKKSLQRKKEVSQVEEIQKLFDSGLLPDKTDFFSEENQDYIRTLKASGRYQEVIKDKRLEQHTNRRDEQERMLEEKLRVVVDTLLRENNPEVINQTISNSVSTEIQKIFSNLTETQQLNLARKAIQQTKEELERLKQRDIVEALGGMGAGAGDKKQSSKEPTLEEINDQITLLRGERKRVGNKGDMNYIAKKIEKGTQTENEIKRKQIYDELTEQINELEARLRRFPF